jgi:hypothetical protein
MPGDHLALPMKVGRSEPVAVPSPRVLAMQAAFYSWWAENSYALEDGGCGDVEGLFDTL